MTLRPLQHAVQWHGGAGRAPSQMPHSNPSPPPRILAFSPFSHLASLCLSLHIGNIQGEGRDAPEAYGL